MVHGDRCSFPSTPGRRATRCTSVVVEALRVLAFSERSLKVLAQHDECWAYIIVTFVWGTEELAQVR